MFFANHPHQVPIKNCFAICCYNLQAFACAVKLLIGRTKVFASTPKYL